MPLTKEQVNDIVIVERVASTLSIIGATFVITTFILNQQFRKPINRLVFYASFGNILANVATLISTTSIESGQNSPLCQFQALMIQWFMPADALWTFAMACNVWLSFFHSYDTAALRRLEYRYLIACYGIPFIPALVYLLIQTHARGRIYGAAVLWCWVSPKWDFLRVATFYGPVWIVILCTIAIYIRVGSVILKWRKSLIKIEKETGTRDTIDIPTASIVKTSEVTVMASQTDQASGKSNSGHANRKASNAASMDPRRCSNHAHVHRSRTGGVDPNKAAIKYCKCALLFFIALIVTWVPSTINRIVTIANPKQSIFGLYVTAGLVLPLQGFWNAVIYIATSTFAVQCLWQDTLELFSFMRPVPKVRVVKQQTPEISQPELNSTSLEFREIRPGVERASSQSELIGMAR